MNQGVNRKPYAKLFKVNKQIFTKGEHNLKRSVHYIPPYSKIHCIATPHFTMHQSCNFQTSFQNKHPLKNIS